MGRDVQCAQPQPVRNFLAKKVVAVQFADGIRQRPAAGDEQNSLRFERCQKTAKTRFQIGQIVQTAADFYDDFVHAVSHPNKTCLLPRSRGRMPDPLAKPPASAAPIMKNALPNLKLDKSA